jgi:hypothetical protein
MAGLRASDTLSLAAGTLETRGLSLLLPKGERE